MNPALPALLQFPDIRLKEAGTEKALIDDLRVRNGNLEINMMVRGAGEGETL